MGSRTRKEGGAREEGAARYRTPKSRGVPRHRVSGRRAPGAGPDGLKPCRIPSLRPMEPLVPLLPLSDPSPLPGLGVLFSRGGRTHRELELKIGKAHFPRRSSSRSRAMRRRGNRPGTAARGPLPRHRLQGAKRTPSLETSLTLWTRRGSTSSLWPGFIRPYRFPRTMPAA